jgi:hypothetical protein
LVEHWHSLNGNTGSIAGGNGNVWWVLYCNEIAVSECRLVSKVIGQFLPAPGIAAVFKDANGWWDSCKYATSKVHR